MNIQQAQTPQPKPPTLEAELPFDPNLEEAVIGGLLINPYMIPAVAQFLKPEHFMITRNTLIYEEMLGIDAAHCDFDYLTVIEALKARKLKNGRSALDEVGGDVYVIGLFRSVASSANVETYARFVAAYAARRQVISLGEQLIQLGQRSDMKLDTMIDQVQAQAGALRVPGEKGTDIQLVVNRYLAHIDNLVESGKAPICPSGWLKVDSKTGGGFRAGEVTVYGGLTGTGKTASTQSMVANICELNRRVYSFGLEMTEIDVMNRYAAMLTGIPLERIKSGALLPGEYGRLMEAVSKVNEWMLDVSDIRSLTPTRVRRMLRAALMRHGTIDMVIIDGLYLMRPDHDWQKRFDSKEPYAEYKAIMNVDDGIPQIADELQVPILITHQLNKNLYQREDKRPSLDDLRGGGMVYENVDYVLAFHRPYVFNKKADKAQAELHVLKTRDGQDVNAIVGLVYDPQYRRYFSGEVIED